MVSCLVRRFLLAVCIAFFLGRVPTAYAGEVLGVHILNPGELDRAEQLLKTSQLTDKWQYVTIPLTLNDLYKHNEWQRFFDQAKEKKFQPIVRLATRYADGAWQIPTRKDITDLAKFMNTLNWPQDERIVVIANEPNHRKEWGGKLDPEGFADISVFAARWLQTESANYTVLPAGMDLAAPNGTQTMDAFVYLRRVMEAQPGFIDNFDGWTSHSYPNPAFSGRPTDTGRMSIQGFRTELAFLAAYTSKELPVYITETGWAETAKTSRWLASYYQYAVQHVWSDSRVRAVTPFLLQGAPGPFEEFSFFSAAGQPTKQFQAYRQALEKM